MSSSPMRLVVCGPVGCGRRTLLSALDDGLPDSERLIWQDDLPSVAAAELLTGPAATDVLVVVDAASGLSSNAARDTRLLTGLGLREVTLAVNKIDLVAYAEEPFVEIAASYRQLSESAGIRSLTCIPVSALHGDNIRDHSGRTGFYSGPTLMEHLLEGRHADRGPARSLPVADRFRVTIVWGAEQPLLPGRAYALSAGDLVRQATIAPLRYRLDLESGEHVAATTLNRDEVGICDIEIAEPIAWPERPPTAPGGFTLLDPVDGTQVGVGLVEYALRRSANVRWQPLTVGRTQRAGRLGQRPAVVWLTGLSGAGKSTVANLVEAELHRRGHHTYLLDGDNVRHGLNSDLGFTAADRVENIRRVAEVARLMADAGLIVIVSFISPFRAERAMARNLLGPGEFFEVYVDTPLEVAERRDPKGLYRKARRGELVNFTGVDSPYEPPADPELRLDTSTLSPDEAASRILRMLETGGRLNPPATRHA